MESLFDLVLLDWPGGSWQNSLKIAGVIFGVYFFAIYLASIYWCYRDIRQRTRDPISQLISVLLVVALFLPGIWIYLILRPRYTLVEHYERSLEEEALLQELEDQKACPNCRRRVDDEFVVCPTCRIQLREPCVHCGRALSHAWLACPYCGSDKAPALATPRRSYVAEPSYEEYGPYYEFEGSEGWQSAQIAAAAAATAEVEPARKKKRPPPQTAQAAANGNRPPEFQTEPGQPRPRPLRDALSKATGKLTNGSKSAANADSAADSDVKAAPADKEPIATAAARAGSAAGKQQSTRPADPAAAPTSERPSVRLGLDAKKPKPEEGSAGPPEKKPESPSSD